MKLAQRWINNAVLVVAVMLIAYGLDRGSQKQFAKRIEAMEVEGMSGPMSEHWQVKPGSIYDGDTLRVVRGNEELKIRFCGIDAPEKQQALGVESRDYLRSLVAQGDGSVVVVPIEQDRYGRTVAELFVMFADGSEIHLNSEMVAAGMAFHYGQYSGNCPNQRSIVMAEEMAKEQRLGVWADASPEYPWEWRRR
ncbi:MAG: thermonuclease family protein [Cyanobacteriota bacterium]|nr:thermonuclease family protein [Cyanobacteriota bacterium]